MSERKLRRQRVIFYISRALENVPTAFQTKAARREYCATLLDQPCAKDGAARLGLICRRLDVILMDGPVKTQFVVGYGGVYPLDHVGLFAVGEYRQPTGEIGRNLYDRVLQG